MIEIEKPNINMVDVSEDGSTWYFYCTDNGQYKIYLDGSLVRYITLQGIDIPAGFPTRLGMCLASPNHFPSQARQSNMYTEGTCINYDVMPTQPNYYYRLDLRELTEAPEQTDFEPVNASIIDFGDDGAVANCILLSVTDATKPAYVYYQGVIIAVFNYT